MNKPATILSLAVRSARISEKTSWTFVVVTCSDGVVGYGEASINGMSGTLRALGSVLEYRLRGKVALPNTLKEFDFESLNNFAYRALLSGAEQALWDALGKRLGVPVCDLLGGALRETVPLYANINRGLPRRDPTAFAEAAQRAVDAGFGFIKIAPFDGMGEDGFLGWQETYAAGLARIEAVCDVTAGKAQVMVDCHWRFDELTAALLIARAAQLRLFWIECPLPETAAQRPALRRLREQASDLGVRLAGMEKGTGLQAFIPYIDEQIYDVLMPDVKYDGGLAETRLIAACADASGLRIAPHNPSGPICHAASIHVSATLANLLFLEFQFEETRHFDSLLTTPLQHEAGFALIPRNPGLGITIDETALRAIEET